MMNRILLFACVLVGVVACSKNYFQQTSASPSYSKTTRYKVILVKPNFVSSKPIQTEEAASRCLFHLRGELSKINFEILPNDQFEEAMRARSFGGSGNVNELVAMEAAKSVGANAVAYTEISTESIQGGLPLMASIRILSTVDGSQLYSGKARSDNPASLEAGLEFAIEKALEGLK